MESSGTTNNQVIGSSNSPEEVDIKTEDGDQGTAFEDNTSASAYTNGNSNSVAATYYATDHTTDPYTTTTAYYNNSSVICSQGVNQLLTDDNIYLVVDQSDPTTLTTTNAEVSQRNSPQTVKWLVDNYETAEGVSLPRSTLYSHYQAHCQQHGIEPVNAASFGKLIRSVFIGLRTRRLGTRGNSKYHYYGIRVKPGSVLAPLTDASSGNNSDSGQPPPKRSKSTPPSGVIGTKATGPDNHQAALIPASPEVLQTYLGDPSSILPSVWPEESTAPCNETDTPSALAQRFAAFYRKHYEQVINAIGNLNFNSIEGLWRCFWQAENSDDKGSLTLDQLHHLTSSPVADGEVDAEALPSLAEWIIQTDYTLYNSLISSLILPNLLKPIPQQLTQQIRNFAKNINTWMVNALVGYDQTFVSLKLSAVGAFSHTLRRYTSLNHLSSAARAVLQNQQQIHQMINDLNRVDFKNVQEQASWVCQCEDQVVDQIEQSFKRLLQESNPFDKWGVWCEQVIEMCLQDNDVRSSTQFFFKWGFYSSLVMRDLTLRSASSFGSFHLIRLLFDEYIFYLIEHKVAKATGKTPLQVLGEGIVCNLYNGK